MIVIIDTCTNVKRRGQTLLKILARILQFTLKMVALERQAYTRLSRQDVITGGSRVEL
jgi:hypothetical protein